MAKTTLAQAAYYLKHAILNWYANVEIDYGVTGHFVGAYEACQSAYTARKADA